MFIVCDKNDEKSLDLAYKRLSAVHQSMMNNLQQKNLKEDIKREVISEASIEIENKAQKALEEIEIELNKLFRK